MAEPQQEHSATTPSDEEVEILLTSKIVDAGMSKDKIQIKCLAVSRRHAFLQFTDSEERDKSDQIREHANKRIDTYNRNDPQS